MTSNMAECFNNVIKGVRALPVTAIIEYTFTKLNAYFLKYSEVTAEQMSPPDDEAYVYKYAPKFDDWIEYQTRKADTQSVEEFNSTDLIYQVNEPGGITQGGVQFGGGSFKVHLRAGECSCARPTVYHLPCSHLMAAGRVRRVGSNCQTILGWMSMQLQQFTPHGPEGSNPS